jgi:3-oxoacyl-[acyl-carrier-protein] synthase-3
MSFTIIGTGSAAPGCVKTNDDLTRLVDTTDEWIVTRTGIRERRICTTETLTDLGCAAAVRALENAGVAVEELDLILCHTLQGDYITPSLSCMLQERLGPPAPPSI